MTARIAVVVFPGTNCEHDVVSAIGAVGGEAELVWHRERSLSNFDGVVIPGGFAHGDYLRPGAIARFSPVMEAVTELAASGGPVVGICNGFQVLAEAGLLPGALHRNRGLKFMCEAADLTVESSRSAITRGLSVGSVLRIPINNFEGSYVCDPATLEQLRRHERVILRYRDNPNGSIDDIAGVCSEDGNVVGLMPHPERASSALTGSEDGLALLGALLGSAGRRAGSAHRGRPGAKARA